MADDFKYDVAFSFLAQDEALAASVNNMLAGRLSTFHYSDHQKELAGKDGVDEFTRVFTTESRVVVVLYRKGWGETKWTRIEETAIKNRGWDKGFDFLFVIPLDKSSAVPAWFPKPRLWFNVERFGSQGAAAAIEERVKEAGGSPHEETAEDIVRRLALDRKVEHRRELALAQNGVTWAEEEVANLYQCLQAVAESSGGQLRVETGRGLLMLGDIYTLGVEWQKRWSNTLDDSALGVTLWEGKLTFQAHVSLRSPRALRTRQFQFDITSAQQRIWREGPAERTLSTEALATECVRMLTEQMRKKS